MPFLLPKGEYVAFRDEAKFKGTCRIQALRSSAEWSQGINREVTRKKVIKESCKRVVMVALIKKNTDHFLVFYLQCIYGMYFQGKTFYLYRKPIFQ